MKELLEALILDFLLERTRKYNKIFIPFWFKLLPKSMRKEISSIYLVSIRLLKCQQQAQVYEVKKQNLVFSKVVALCSIIFMLIFINTAIVPNSKIQILNYGVEENIARQASISENISDVQQKTVILDAEIQKYSSTDTASTVLTCNESANSYIRFLYLNLK